MPAGSDDVALSSSRDSDGTVGDGSCLDFAAGVRTDAVVI